MRQTKSILLALGLSAVAFALPVTARADDHHGHGGGGGHGDWDHGHGGHNDWHGSHWYGGFGYSHPYYYNNYGYGYGYGPYYRSYGWWPSLSFSFSRPATTYYTTRYVDQDNLMVDVQRALARRGYYRGPIDGAFGPMTRAAIRSYQVDRGLAITGRVDGAVVRSLGI